MILTCGEEFLGEKFLKNTKLDPAKIHDYEYVRSEAISALMTKEVLIGVGQLSREDWDKCHELAKKGEREIRKESKTKEKFCTIF